MEYWDSLVRGRFLAALRSTSRGGRPGAASRAHACESAMHANPGLNGPASPYYGKRLRNIGDPSPDLRSAKSNRCAPKVGYG